jgi:hypothetical protein
MKNNTSYFSHDYNASNDFKVLLMRNKLGIKGYGMYWFLIERLAEAEGYLPLEMIPIYATQMQVELEEANSLVNDFKLFEVSDNEFFSERLLRHLELREQDKIKKSNAGKKSAEIRLQKPVSTEIEQTFNTRSTAVQQRKEKKSKVNEIKEINKVIDYSPFSLNFLKKWDEWKQYKKVQWKYTYKLQSAEQSAFNKLKNLSNGNEQTACEIIEQSISNGWKGFFELKSGKTEPANRDQDRIDYWNHMVDTFGTDEEKATRKIV